MEIKANIILLLSNIGWGTTRILTNVKKTRQSLGIVSSEVKTYYKKWGHWQISRDFHDLYNFWGLYIDNILPIQIEIQLSLLIIDNFSHETTIVTYQKKKTLIISNIFLFIRWRNNILCFFKDPLRNLNTYFGVKDILKYSFFFSYFCIWMWLERKNQKAVRGDLDIWLRWDHGHLTIFSYLYNQNSYKFKKNIGISMTVKNT